MPRFGPFQASRKSFTTCMFLYHKLQTCEAWAVTRFGPFQASPICFTKTCLFLYHKPQTCEARAVTRFGPAASPLQPVCFFTTSLELVRQGAVPRFGPFQASRKSFTTFLFLYFKPQTCEAGAVTRFGPFQASPMLH